MFGKGKNQMETGITLIANNCEITGDICFSDELWVNGIVKGNIIARENSRAKVTVSEKGQVKGDIRVPDVIVNGKVDGDIYSSKHVELAAKAEVNGNVYYHLIEMVKGSAVDGSLVHTETEDDKQGVPRVTLESGEQSAGQSGDTTASRVTSVEGKKSQTG